MVKLIRSNIHKDKKVLIIFSMIIIVATFLMSLSLMAKKYRGLYDEYIKETGAADFVAFAASYGKDERIAEHFNKADYVGSYTDTDVVMLTTFTFTTSKSSKEKNGAEWMFQSIDDEKATKSIVFTDRDESVQGKKIYLNIYTAYSNNLKTGDMVYIDSAYGKYEYTVAGIYQHLFMGTTYTYYSVMVDKDEFAQLQEDRDSALQKGVNAGWNHMINVNIKDGYKVEKCIKDTKTSLAGNLNIPSEGFTNKEGNDAYSAIVNILAGFMGAFAVIVMAICVVIILFTINNNINRDVTNIGALKAVGYTVRQIRVSLMAEYTLISLIATGVGIGLSYALYPALEKGFIRQISGLIWKSRFDFGDCLMILVGVVGVILVSTFIITGRIRKLHPADALRFGLKTNPRKKSFMPLAVIMFSVAFVLMFSGVLYYNTQVDISKFQRMIVGDVADAFFYVKDGSSDAAEKTMEKLEKVDGIEHAYTLAVNYAYVGDREIDLVYGKNPDGFSFDLYDGRMFRDKNETVVGMTLAEDIGAKVGDEINVSYGGKEMSFTITGLQQSALNNRIYISDDAAVELGVPVSYDYIRVSIKDADTAKVDDVINSVMGLGDSNIKSADNQFKFQRSEENTPVFAVGFIVLLLVLLNIVVVFLVIRLLLKTVFIKREKEFGIKKAVGFTSLQLRYQLSLSLIPSTILATALGVVAGYVFVNPIFAAVLGNYGLKTSRLIIKPELMLVSAVAVTVLVFIFSFIMSGRMKRISAYRLIQE